MNGLLGGYSREITRVLDCSAICWIVQCVSWLGLAHVNYPFHMPANCCSALEAVTKSRRDTMGYTTIIGIDVSKNFADACVISAQGEVMLETKIFYYTIKTE